MNGHVTPVLLDSGAAISVVPESMVEPSQLTGEYVAVKPFGANKSTLLPTAELLFKIGSLEWVEGVAVSPRQEGVEEEVLYSLDLQSKRGWELVLLVNKVDQKEVLRVMTRAQTKGRGQEQEEEELAAVTEQPKAKPIAKEVIETVVEVVPVLSENRKEEGPEEEFEQEVLCFEEEELEEEFLGIEKEPYVEEEDLVFDLRKDSEGEPDLVVPPVEAGSQGRAALVAETKVDPSLEKWRRSAEKGEDGLVWRDGLLYKSMTTHVLEKVFLMVLPKPHRNRVLKIAHENLGHMGARRVKAY